jgi:predicted 2-oxoglutarate/Fe(II)-dependent dioxygenase YbiX
VTSRSAALANRARHYEGADLVLCATGEHLRPSRGDVLLFRGDVEHWVTPLTAGRRVVLTAFKPEPRPCLLPPDD